MVECLSITSFHQVRHAEVPSGGRGQVGGQPPGLRRGRRPRPLPRRARAQAAVMTRNAVSRQTDTYYVDLTRIRL